jgi:hypothetical protein
MLTEAGAGKERLLFFHSGGRWPTAAPRNKSAIRSA